MLAFIISLKPKSQSKNWERECDLLKQTLQSLLNQTSSNYKVFVIFSDDPQLQNLSDKVMFIKFPLHFYSVEEIPESTILLPDFGNNKTLLERRWDNTKKKVYGCKIAKEQGCTYIMAVDSDDLMSNKLVAYIDERISQKDIPGFFIPKGFLIHYGKKRMIKINKGMENFNGSTHIIKSDFVSVPDVYTGKWIDCNLFTSHGWIRSRLKKQYDIELEAIPFPAVVYVAHGGNISNVSHQKFKQKLKHLIKLIIRGQFVNRHLREEFSIAK